MSMNPGPNDPAIRVVNFQEQTSNEPKNPIAITLSFAAVAPRAPKFAAAVLAHRGRPFELLVSAAAFERFIRICEGDLTTPTRDICYDLFLLADTFRPDSGPDHVLADLIALVNNDPGKLAIPALRFAHATGKLNPADYQSLLADHFQDCEVDDLATLDISVLDHIIHFPDPSDPGFDRVFDLVFELSRTFGPQIAILFGGVDRFRLTSEQNMRLRSIPQFAWPFLDHSNLGSIEAEQARQKRAICNQRLFQGVHILVSLALLAFWVYVTYFRETSDRVVVVQSTPDLNEWPHPIEEEEETEATSIGQRETDQTELLRQLQEDRLREYQAELIRQLKADQTKFTAQLGDEHAKSIAQLREDQAELIRELKADQAKFTTQLGEEHAKSIAQLREEHAESIRQLNNEHAVLIRELKADQTKFTTQLGEEHAKSIAQLREEHPELIRQLKNEQARGLANLKRANRNETVIFAVVFFVVVCLGSYGVFRALESSTDGYKGAQTESSRHSAKEQTKSIARLKQEHKEAMDSLKKEHTESIARLKQEQTRSIDESIQDHCKSIHRVMQEHTAAIGEFRVSIAHIQRELRIPQFEMTSSYPTRRGH
jgi:gas vesicle protein